MRDIKGIKKIICIALLLLIFICFSSFSAIVSDNDGAAFITKAEFESLKKDFNKQISNYNSSIDNKIDGAIAAYLAGLRLSERNVVSLPYADWENVTSLNYALSNNYWYPDVSLTVSMLAGMMWDLEMVTNPVRFGYESWWAFAQLMYSRPTSTYSRRLLCEAGKEGTTYPEDIIWGGLASNYVDNITLLRTYHCGSHDRFGYLWGSSYDSMALCRATCIKSGYFDDLSTEDFNVWDPNFFWTGQNAKTYVAPYQGGTGWGDAGYRSIDDIYNKSNVTSITLKEVNNKKTLFNHIINYNNMSYDYFSDVDWLKTLTEFSDNSLTRETFLQAMTSVNSKYANVEFWNQDHLKRTDETDGRLETDTRGIRVHTAQDLFDIVSGEGIQNYGAVGYNWYNLDKTDNTTMVTVGLIPKNYTSEHIKQTEKGFSQVVDNNQYDGNVLNLYNGFALLAAKVDDIIEWNPVFIDTYSNDTATNFELKVSLALEPFGEGNTVSSPDRYIIFEGETTANPKETSGGKCKIRFKMPESGIVYAKWWPATSSIESTNWRATLDLTQCNTYIREVA